MAKQELKGIKKLVGKKVKVIEQKPPYVHIIGTLKALDNNGWVEIQTDNGATIFYTREAIGCLGEHIE